MSCKIDLIKRDSQNTVQWSGGFTTEIAIYPPEAQYSKRNFSLRLSVAQVDVEESTFTALPGIERVLMVLDGKMKLEHLGHHSVLLTQFQQDCFSGDWTTKSYGQASDFNLMMSGPCHGRLKLLTVKQEEFLRVADQVMECYKARAVAFYCIGGDVTVMFNHLNSYTLSTGDALIIYQQHQMEPIELKICNSEIGEVYLVQADIIYEP